LKQYPKEKMCDNILNYIARTDDGLEEAIHQSVKITNKLTDSIYLDVAIAQDHFETLSDQIVDTLKAKMILEEKCIELIDHKEMLLERNENLNYELATERSHGKESKDALKDLDHKYAQLLEKNENSQKLVKELSKSLDDKNETINSLEEVASNANNLTSKLKKSTCESKELDDTLKLKELMITDLEEQLETSQRELLNLRTKYDTLEAEKIECSAIKENLETKSSKQENDLQSTEKDLTEKNNRLREYQHLTDNLSAQRSNLEMEIAILKANYQKAIETVTNDERELMKQKELIEELETLVEDKTQLVKSLSKDLSLHKEYNADLQEDVASLEEEFKITREELCKQQKEYTLIEKEYEEKQSDLKSVVSHYETSSKSYETQLQTATHNLENASKTIAVMVNQQLASIDENAEKQKKMLKDNLYALRDLNEEHCNNTKSDAAEQKKTMMAVMTF